MVSVRCLSRSAISGRYLGSLAFAPKVLLTRTTGSRATRVVVVARHPVERRVALKVGLFITSQQTLDTDMVSALEGQFAMVRLARDRGWDSRMSASARFGLRF